MDLTVLRSPVYAHHDPYILQEGVEYDYMDQGYQEFDYVIAPHDGSWKNGDVVRKAALLNQPLAAVVETYHEGGLAQRGGFLSISSPNVQLTCLKRAEDGEDWILRVHEYTGVKTEVNIELPLCGKTIHAALNPYEIATFAISANPDSAAVRRVNFLEWGELDQ